MDTLTRAYDRFARVRQLNLAALRLTPPAARTVIPRGLRNHLHWQAGHLVTVQASLLYLRSGLTPFLDEAWFSAFAKGTAPANWTGNEPSWDQVLLELERSLPLLSGDLAKYGHTLYPAPIAVSTGDTLTSFKDALEFLSVHEALHVGTIGTMLRILGVIPAPGRIT